MKTLIILLGFSVWITSCNNNSDKKATSPDEAKTDTEHTAHKIDKENSGYCDGVNTGMIKEDTLKGSPHRVAMATINGTHVHIDYNSPGVKGRIIWGGLVPFGKIWVSGAHYATTVQFAREVIVGNKTIPRGTYSLFTIPGKEEWVVIFNSRSEQHLADEYSDKEDIARVKVTPGNSGMVQRLTYSVSKTDEQSGTIRLQWEKLMIDIPFKTTGIGRREP